MNDLVSIWKIPSGEITNYPYLLEIAHTGKPVILSTGMATLLEVREALSVLESNGVSDITLLHCTTDYPTPMKDVYLYAMQTLHDEFGYSVGYSDHTCGVEVSIAAVAMGVRVIEKHFTLNRNMPGPDHQASLEPDELKQLISSVRNVEQAMGSHDKVPTKAELRNRDVARKSIVALRDIRAGEVLSS